MKPRTKIVIFIDWFAPGYKAGGPTRSVMNLVGWLGKTQELWVITGDRDLGDVQPYPGIKTGEWTDYEGRARVLYLPPELRNQTEYRKWLLQIQPDKVYLNSMYSIDFAWKVVLAAKGVVASSDLILAPRGMLRPSALKYKSLKKQVFLRGIQLLGWAKRMVFHATDEEEATDVRNVFGQAQPVIIGPNLPKPIPETVPPELHKVAGKLKMIFVARVVPIKNLDLVLSALKEVHQEILLSVVGPAEDKPYLQAMQELVLTLPANVQIDFKGAFPAVEIEHMLASHHVFILPTQGENFGHAIFEALQAGTPVIISDQTPWKGLLDHHAGMDLSLDKPEDFADAIRLFADMDQRTYNLWSKGAFDFALNFMHQSDYLAAYQRLFARP